MDKEQTNISINSNKINAKLDVGNIAFQLKYQQNGITYISNNDAVIPRDQGGNIMLQEDVDNNPMLIIEPVATNITTNSMLKILDTQFTYFKFPTRFPIETNLDLDLDLNIDLTNDIVYARYKPSENLVLGYVTETGPPSSRASGILMDEVVEGAPQTNINAYYVTKEVKDSGVDLRFRAKINHQFDSPAYSAEQIAKAKNAITSDSDIAKQVAFTITDLLPGYAEKSYIWFFISQQGPDKPLDRAVAGPFAQFSANPLYSNEWGSIAQFEVQNTFIDVVIPNSQFEAGDYFGITQINAYGATETTYHTINSEQSYWTVTDASKNVDEWNREL
jgi:hypothetical protein